jgi:hypothetical protein
MANTCTGMTEIQVSFTDYSAPAINSITAYHCAIFNYIYLLPVP